MITPECFVFRRGKSPLVRQPLCKQSPMGKHQHSKGVKAWLVVTDTSYRPTMWPITASEVSGKLSVGCMKSESVQEICDDAQQDHQKLDGEKALNA